MPRSRPNAAALAGQDPSVVPFSCQRILKDAKPLESLWIGPEEALKLSQEDAEAYALARDIHCHLAIEAPLKRKSGHPGGPLSAFTFSYAVQKVRNPSVDQPLRMSPGHLSVLGYGLQWLFGREGQDARLQSPQTIIDTFRTPAGLPGHIEAGIGDIPFGTGPLGKGVSNALGAAFGLKHQKKAGYVDVVLADGDSQEGQVMEAFRLAAHLRLDNLVVHGDFNDIQLSGKPTETVAADFASLAYASGWYVIEVQNGNDYAQVRAALEAAKQAKHQPVFICYYTTMGHGIALMEEGTNNGKKNYHGSPLSPEDAEKARAGLPPLADLIAAYEPYRAKEKARQQQRTVTDIPLSWKLPSAYARKITSEKAAARQDFGAVHLKNLMAGDERIVVLHADLAGSGGFDKVEKEFPNRVVNVGVAEANMAMMAAGMRQTGLLPVTYTFAAFGTNEARANARLIDVNCGHTRCGVLHDCTHAGLSVGEDGETHQERHYLNIPFDHTQVWCTADANQAAAMAEKAMEVIAEGHQSVFTFFPRSGTLPTLSPDGTPVYGTDYVFDGKADLVRGQGDTSDQITIIATGLLVPSAIAAADALLAGEQKIRVRVLNVACVRPLDSSAVIKAALETGHIIVAEDHSSESGLAAQVADVIADFSLPCSLRRLGVNHYFPSGSAEDLLFLAGLDTESLMDAVQDEVRAEVRGGEDAFVTAVYALRENGGKSRFGDSSSAFRQQLLEQDGYLEALREFWRSRAVDQEKLPTNAQLRDRLGLTGNEL